MEEVNKTKKKKIKDSKTGVIFKKKGRRSVFREIEILTP